MLSRYMKRPLSLLVLTDCGLAIHDDLVVDALGTRLRG